MRGLSANLGVFLLSRVVACVLTSVLLQVLHPLVGRADDLGAPAGFQRNLSTIRAGARRVQGTFRAYRSEKAILAALTKPPSEIEIPLVRSGSLWRDDKRFRADYVLVQQRQTKESAAAEVVKTQQAVAIDEDRVFELSFGIEPESGILRSMNVETPEGAGSLTAIRRNYFEPLDALWSLNDVAFVDLLQRPDVTIQPNSFLSAGNGLLLTSTEAGKSRYELEFEPAAPHPFGYGVFLHEGSGFRIKMQRRVLSSESSGVLLPVRVVDVATTGETGEGYTTVVELDLKPLEPQSPVARRIVSESFRDLGSGFQIYQFEKGKGEELGQRLEARADPRIGHGNHDPGFRGRSWLLWLNGALILVVSVVYAYRRFRRKS